MRISSNYGLKLMEGTDNVKRQDFVDNFSKIDTEMRAIENEAYPIVEATGTNAYIGANVRIQSLKKGTKLTLFVGTNATGNCSLNLNSYGAKNIKDSNGNIVTNMKANIPYNLCYNGTDFILQGKGGGGNLIPKYLLAGYYGEGDNGRVDGAMANNGAVTSTLTAGTSYTIPAGYHNGSGKITANSLASQTSATATANQILSGYTAWINGSKVTGSIASQEAQTITPSTSNQTIPAGNYLSGVQTIKGDSNLLAKNIISGKSIFGVNGTASIANLGGIKIKTGSIYIPSKSGEITYNIECGFKPIYIITRISGDYIILYDSTNFIRPQNLSNAWMISVLSTGFSFTNPLPNTLADCTYNYVAFGN